MGTDIHPHIEIKLDGEWQHWTAPKIVRWYQLFGRLAGIRCPDEPHPPVRGLPPDATCLTLWDHTETFGHTASWITWEELAEVQQWVESVHPEFSKPGHGWHQVIGYLRGRAYVPDGREVTDIRMVFWFDN